MKKQFIILALFIVFGFFTFVNAAEQEEIDFLLFFPNSGDQFVNTEQANIQLDNLAKYLRERSLVSGQIIVYGYAAVADNEIEPLNLSMDRAVFVINELQKRGVSGDLFSDPVAYGAVNLWGSNSDEESRIPNRRVRILLDGNFLTPLVIQAAEPEIVPAIIEDTVSETGSKFPWKLLLFLLLIPLIIALILLAASHRKKPTDDTAGEEAPQVSAVTPPPAPPVAATREREVDLDEEIRLRAYELSGRRSDWEGDMDGDWYMAMCEILPRYEAAGYRIDFMNGHWMAIITEIKK